MVKHKQFRKIVSEYRQNLGRALFEERFARKLKLHDVSLRLGISKKSIEKAELGCSCPLQHIALIAELYGKRLKIELTDNKN